MTVLTGPQRVFVARAAIVDVVGAYQTDDGDTLDSIDVASVPDEELVALGVEQDILDGYRLALEDLEKARVVMEEQAAFGHLLEGMITDHPDTDRAQLRKAVRSLVADPATRERAAEESGVYQKMGFAE